MKANISADIHKANLPLEDIQQLILENINGIGFKLKNKESSFALFHKSFVNEFRAGAKNYERFEFLGDSVIQLVVTNLLIKKYSNKSEGVLSKTRSMIVSQAGLTKLSDLYDLSSLVILGFGEYKNELHKNLGVKCDIFEAVFGAIYLEHGYKYAEERFLLVLSDYKEKYNFDFIDQVIEENQDYRSMLQELCQKSYGHLPDFVITEEENIFKAVCCVNNKQYGPVQASSKKLSISKLSKEIFLKLKR